MVPKRLNGEVLFSGDAPWTAGGTHLRCSRRGTRQHGALAGESGVCGVAEELHGTGTEPPQGFQRDCAEQMSEEYRVLLSGAVCKA
jgi:hypothetical protein